jgi:hypothetical protein
MADDDLLAPDDAATGPGDEALEPDDPGAVDDRDADDGIRGAEHLGLSPPG